MGEGARVEMSGSRNSFLPYGRQCLDEADVAAVVAALESDYLTTGPRVETFERALADYCGARYAVAVASGTAALHVAMLAAGIGRGQRVLTSANTFLASANCAEFVGATADFADIDPRTYNVTADTLRNAWKDDVRAVVPVDFAGQPCGMKSIAGLARERGALVIEDASHSIGSQFEDETGRRFRTGGHGWADMTTFSFHPVKTITTGEGGAILTNDAGLADRCRLFRNHGMVKTGVPADGSGVSSPALEQGSWYYEMTELGFNYRITDIQCALGLSQLAKLDSFVARRMEIVKSYNEAFVNLPLVVTPCAMNSSPAWHIYVVQVDFGRLGRGRQDVMDDLRRKGVGTQVHYIPVHLQPYYRRKYGYAAGKCPVAESYYQRCLSLPLYPDMTGEDVRRVTDAVCEVLKV